MRIIIKYTLVAATAFFCAFGGFRLSSEEHGPTNLFSAASLVRSDRRRFVFLIFTSYHPRSHIHTTTATAASFYTDSMSLNYNLQQSVKTGWMRMGKPQCKSSSLR